MTAYNDARSLSRPETPDIKYYASVMKGLNNSQNPLAPGFKHLLVKELIFFTTKHILQNINKNCLSSIFSGKSNDLFA